MSFSELVRTALHSLRINPLRSALSILGVVFGITAVVVLISMGNGVRAEITEQIRKLGTNLIVVRSGAEEESSDAMPNAALRAEQVATSTLVYEDVDALKNVEGVKSVSGIINQFIKVEREGKSVTVNLIGGDSAIEDVRELEFEKKADSWSLGSQEQGTCAVGHKIMTALFGERNDIIGEKVRVGTNEFVIKAVTKEKKKSLFSDPNRDFYVTLEDARNVFGVGGTEKVLEINVLIDESDTRAR